MRKHKARSVKNLKQWAYFAPDGYIQVRSIADTKKLSRQMIASREPVTWKDYEKAGFFVRKVIVNIKEFNP